MHCFFLGVFFTSENSIFDDGLTSIQLMSSQEGPNASLSLICLIIRCSRLGRQISNHFDAFSNYIQHKVTKSQDLENV